MTAYSPAQAVHRLGLHQSSTKTIDLKFKHHTDDELAELADCLLARPNVFTGVWLAGNELTDETGVKLARYLAASSTIERLDLSFNHFGEATYLALAAALCVKKSLKVLYLYKNQPVDQTRVDAAFVDALRLIPVRPIESRWHLYSNSNDFERLSDAADELGHPSLQMQLALLC